MEIWNNNPNGAEYDILIGILLDSTDNIESSLELLEQYYDILWRTTGGQQMMFTVRLNFTGRMPEVLSITSFVLSHVSFSYRRTGHS